MFGQAGLFEVAANLFFLDALEDRRGKFQTQEPNTLLLGVIYSLLPFVVFGALISPPDAVAALAVTQNLKVPRKIIVILEGESLVNDATSFISFRFAVAAVLTGTFSLGCRKWA